MDVTNSDAAAVSREFYRLRSRDMDAEEALRRLRAMCGGRWAITLDRECGFEIVTVTEAPAGEDPEAWGFCLLAILIAVAVTAAITLSAAAISGVAVGDLGDWVRLPAAAAGVGVGLWAALAGRLWLARRRQASRRLKRSNVVRLSDRRSRRAPARGAWSGPDGSAA